MGAVTHPIDRKGAVFPRGTGRFLVKKGVNIASFRCLSEERLGLVFVFAGGRPHAEEMMARVGHMHPLINLSNRGALVSRPPMSHEWCHVAWDFVKNWLFHR